MASLSQQEKVGQLRLLGIGSKFVKFLELFINKLVGSHLFEWIRARLASVQLNHSLDFLVQVFGQAEMRFVLDELWFGVTNFNFVLLIFILVLRS